MNRTGLDKDHISYFFDEYVKMKSNYNRAVETLLDEIVVLTKKSKK